MVLVFGVDRIVVQHLFHTLLKATPFQVVYGREPPAIVRLEEGLTTDSELETPLREMDFMLEKLKCNLLRAQALMKKSEFLHRRDVEFKAGSRVYLKLKLYKQQSIHRRVCQKLYAKFFGPFEVLERMGKAAYKLVLLPSSKIHIVFHVYQLKAIVGSGTVVNPIPPFLWKSWIHRNNQWRFWRNIMIVKEHWNCWFNGVIVYLMTIRGCCLKTL